MTSELRPGRSAGTPVMVGQLFLALGSPWDQVWLCTPLPDQGAGREGDLREALDAAGVLLAVLEFRRMGFRDGRNDVHRPSSRPGTIALAAFSDGGSADSLRPRRQRKAQQGEPRRVPGAGSRRRCCCGDPGGRSGDAALSAPLCSWRCAGMAG